ncbi:ABC transporter ATP-binding protein [Clostridium cylindrosporum]|uniref:ABC-type multidrug transport system, ATPase component n=1 Tax=Clostridium cylindrosporum DSM 605 TaxID=1121307 RepID=A0A0J8DBI0_CLOCY|nr:ABC transporter ATP-binding protein [Clostridium cylindrosporum]KMT23202.1 ABC-type multidrug transport system, ATPase component [Clostridium cylindrosporum DSM 605]
MEKESVVSISNLQVSYDKNIILDNISLEIPKGEIIGLLGPSGSGKTTLIKSIMGMVKASQGEVVVLGYKIPSLEVVQSIGYMAQSDALYDDLSALDNILFFAELYGIKGKIAKERADEVLELVDLINNKKKLVKNFSGGMKRRLSLAISLLHNPILLILDEPTVGIDPLLRKNFWNEFKRIKSLGGTIIVTTHVMDEAYNCDRLSLIRDGKIIADGSPKELMKISNADNIDEAFLYFSTSREEI